VSELAGKRLTRRHLLDRPQGVRGRNSDNSRLREFLDWEPSISLEAGLAETYRWIAAQLSAADATAAALKQTALPKAEGASAGTIH
jgi:nucleoside-diphosphate-sugar epimerase